MALPKVVIVLGFLMAIFSKQIKYGHVEPPDFKRFFWHFGQ
jgi:hypothetical protein